MPYGLARHNFNLEKKKMKIVTAIHLPQLSSQEMPVKAAHPCCTWLINCMQGTHYNNNSASKINIK